MTTRTTLLCLLLLPAVSQAQLQIDDFVDAQTVSGFSDSEIATSGAIGGARFLQSEQPMNIGGGTATCMLDSAFVSPDPGLCVIGYDGAADGSFSASSGGPLDLTEGGMQDRISMMVTATDVDCRINIAIYQPGTGFWSGIGRTATAGAGPTLLEFPYSEQTVTDPSSASALEIIIEADFGGPSGPGTCVLEPVQATPVDLQEFSVD